MKDLEIPKRLKKLQPFWGEWVIDDYIGSGSFGEVYRIVRKRRERRYAALKWIQIPQKGQHGETFSGDLKREQLRRYREQKDLILREVRAMDQVRENRNVVRFEDCLINESGNGEEYDILIRMELLTPLTQRYPIGPLDEGTTVRIGLDICLALAVCQSRNMIHRDLKPGNIFIDSEGNFKLGDFGIARILEEGQAGTTQIGTPAYMAPEMLLRSQTYDQTVDMYALAVMMYRYVNDGRLPFFHETDGTNTLNREEKAIYRRMSLESVPPASQASEGLNRILLKAMAPDPKDRYQKAGDMWQDLASLPVHSDSTDGIDPPPPPPLPPPLPKHNSALIVAAGIILSIIILLAVFLGKQWVDLSNSSGTIFALENDEQSDHVRTLQRYLKQFSFYTGDENGNFDTATKNAYLAFCRLNGIKETVDKDGYVAIMDEEWDNIARINVLNIVTATPGQIMTEPSVVEVTLTPKPVIKVTPTPTLYTPTPEPTPKPVIEITSLPVVEVTLTPKPVIKVTPTPTLYTPTSEPTPKPVIEITQASVVEVTSTPVSIVDVALTSTHIIKSTLTPTPTSTPKPTPVTGSKVKYSLEVVSNCLGKMDIQGKQFKDVASEQELSSIIEYPTEDVVYVPYFQVENMADVEVELEVRATMDSKEYSFKEYTLNSKERHAYYISSVAIEGGEHIIWYVNGEKLAVYDVPKKKKKIEDSKVGDIVLFGSYEQDNNTSNGKEDIEWLVLEKEADRMLVISRYALDAQPYNKQYISVTWEICSLRTWLNHTFIENAFDSTEKDRIKNITVRADKNPKYSTSPGNDTNDKVFLLSISEAEKYFSSNEARGCQGTEYCYGQGDYKNDSGNCNWWLRSPGYDDVGAACVYGSNGAIGDYGRSVDSALGVRPAMWINLKYEKQEVAQDDKTESYISSSNTDVTENTDRKTEQFKMVKVGDIVLFGSYEQDDYTANGKEDIEWLVLARNGNKALLLSRYGLDAQPYDKEDSNTWEECTLRTWLNGTFLNKAFTAREQADIVLTSVDNSSNQGYSKYSLSGSNSTQDRIFLLSYAEANKYLGVTFDNNSNTKSRVAPTAYAIEQGAYVSNREKTEDGATAGWWWLRSPGCYQYYAANVYYDGSLYNFDVSYDSGCVRPALWINLGSDEDNTLTDSVKIMQNDKTDNNNNQTLNSSISLKGICKANNVNIRRGPAMNTGTLGQINKGDVLEIISQQGEWSKIRSGTKEGYIKSQYIEINDDNHNSIGVDGNNERSTNEQKLKNAKVGDIVLFGKYEQDNNSSNGKEDIEWLVLARDGNKTLLITRYGLDVQPYNKKSMSITWEKCTLRTWLNGTFLNNAFTAAEKKRILRTNVDNGGSQGYSEWSTRGENNTQDRVFLLSYAEANKYLGVKYDAKKNRMKSRVAPTAYALEQGAFISSSDKTADGAAAGWWWLRSPGRYQGSAAVVDCVGSIYSHGVDYDDAVVRPALWLILGS